MNISLREMQITCMLLIVAITSLVVFSELIKAITASPGKITPDSIIQIYLPITVVLLTIILFIIIPVISDKK